MFENHWNYIVHRSVKNGIPVVQDSDELEYVYNLMQGCKSYLEVGTAEGNSLYVLTKAMPAGSKVTFVDFGENHTAEPRQAMLDLLKDYDIKPIYGNSNHQETYDRVSGMYDAVMIDAGHTYDNVINDAENYGQFANKYIFFHDIQIPDVLKAFEEYAEHRSDCRQIRVVNSANYGFGILEIK